MKTELTSAISALAERQVCHTPFLHVWELHPFLLSISAHHSGPSAFWLQKEFLAIVTVMLIASICLSGTLSFCLFFFGGGVHSVAEEWRREREVSGLAAYSLELCICPNYRLSLFISLPHPSASSVLRISVPSRYVSVEVGLPMLQ